MHAHKRFTFATYGDPRSPWQRAASGAVEAGLTAGVAKPDYNRS